MHYDLEAIQRLFSMEVRLKALGPKHYLLLEKAELELATGTPQRALATASEARAVASNSIEKDNVLWVEALAWAMMAAARRESIVINESLFNNGLSVYTMIDNARVALESIKAQDEEKQALLEMLKHPDRLREIVKLVA